MCDCVAHKVAYLKEFAQMYNVRMEWNEMECFVHYHFSVIEVTFDLQIQNYAYSMFNVHIICLWKFIAHYHFFFVITIRKCQMSKSSFIDYYYYRTTKTKLLKKKCLPSKTKKKTCYSTFPWNFAIIELVIQDRAYKMRIKISK